jgi:predicted nucleic acid-binding protein
MLYFDTSALLKLFRPTAETDGLRAWITRQPEPKPITSALSALHVLRVARAEGPDSVEHAKDLLAEIDTLPVSPAILEAAADIPGNVAPTDAIQLASALRLRAELTAFVVYDNKLAMAADAVGLPIAAPGIIG